MASNHHLESARDCDAVRDLIPEYAFGLTNPDETRLVESRLPFCPEAAAQLADFQRLQEAMRESVPQIEPPPRLGARLITAIEVEREARRFTIRLPWVAAAAAIFALVITNVYWLLRVEDLSRRQDALAALLQGGNAFVLTSANNLRWVRLPADNDGETVAFMMWSAESDTGLLYVHGFPRLEPGKMYQLWLTRGEERVSAGTFEVDEEGNAALIFHTPKPIDNFTWARVTDEPEYGSDQPTGTVVVHGEL